MQTRRIDSRHIAQPQDHDWPKHRQVGGHIDELVGHAEQERAVNPKNGHVGRHVLVLQHMRAPAFDVLRRQAWTLVVSVTR